MLNNGKVINVERARKRPFKCPKCGSDDVNTYTEPFDGDVEVKCECCDCLESWLEILRCEPIMYDFNGMLYEYDN